MSEWQSIEASITEATGFPFAVKHARRAHGGCIHQSWQVTGEGREFFVKRANASDYELFEAEQAGLVDWRNAGALRTPEPIALGRDESASWLVLEWVSMRPLTPSEQRQFGVGLAKLHQHRASGFGWTRDNHIGRTPQPNAWESDWIGFLRERRLGFQLDLAARKGVRFRNAERLLDALPVFFESYDPEPGLIHGDLWSGNFAATSTGAPVIYDPATYYADPEADFGLLFMFGGVTQEFWHGYQSVSPLADDFERRVPLYRLYHELNHENLFGGYGAQAQRSIDEALRMLEAS